MTYSKNRLLVVDDDKIQTEVTARLMAIRGFESDTFTDPELAYMALHEKMYHCMIVDAAMPEISGTKLIETIRRHSDIPIVVLTAMYNYKNDQCDAVFIKPPNWDLVAATCKKLAQYYAEKRNAERKLREHKQGGDIQAVPI